MIVEIIDENTIVLQDSRLSSCLRIKVNNNTATLTNYNKPIKVKNSNLNNCIIDF